MKLARDIMRRGEAALGDVPQGIIPPARTTAYDPLTLSTVFRGIQVLQTSIAGLPIMEVKNRVRINDVNSLILQPDVNRSRRDFISDIVASLAIDGNAFIRLVRFGGDVISLEVLPPHLVTVTDDSQDPAAPRYRYSYLGKTYTSQDVKHLKFLNIPGDLRGRGPISAARAEIQSAQKARDYKNDWYDDGGNIKGYLKTDQNITQEAAQTAKDEFTKGSAGSIRVLGKNLSYVPLQLNPADLQFIETQQFDTTQIARLLGIPASIMLASVQGSNLTYSNIEQAWKEFADYTLAAYTGEIEELLTAVIPRGHEARFNWDSSQRVDMNNRYNAYNGAIDAGWLSINDVRAKEYLPPFTQDTVKEPTSEQQ